MELLKIVIMIVVPVATSLLTYYAQKYFNQLIVILKPFCTNVYLRSLLLPIISAISPLIVSIPTRERSSRGIFESIKKSLTFFLPFIPEG